MKLCLECDSEMPIDSHGNSVTCSEKCHKEKRKKQYATWHQENKESKKAYNRKWNRNNKKENGNKCVIEEALSICGECGSEIPINRNRNFKTCSSECRTKRINRKILDRNIKNPAKTLLKRARSRAKGRDLEFNITLEDIHIPEYCPIFNIPLNAPIGSSANNMPSLDRIDSSKGYTQDNVHVISWLANSLKNEATFEQLITLGCWAEKQITGKRCGCLGEEDKTPRDLLLLSNFSRGGE